MMFDGMQADINVCQFFKGYSEGRFDSYGWPQILKLRDWPPSSLFKEHLPRHGAEFISGLPFKEYTHPNGYLNLIVNSPNKQGVGPKMHIAYGVVQELGRGDSVTKIHCNAYDEVWSLLSICKNTCMFVSLDGNFFQRDSTYNS